MAAHPETQASWLPPEPLYLSALRALLLVPATGGRKDVVQRAIDAVSSSARADAARSFLPEFLRSPEASAAAVPDGLALALWPAVRSRLEAALAQEISEKLLPFAAFVRLESLSLGREPPRLGAIHCPLLGGGASSGAAVIGVAPPEDVAVVEADVMWGGGGGGGEEEEEDVFCATFSAGGGGGRSSSFLSSLIPRLHISLAEPQLLLRTRLTLRPVTPDPPFVGSAAVSLLAPPHVDAALRVGVDGSSSLDVMALPLIGPLIRTLIRRLLVAKLAYPRCACVELSPGGSRPPMPAGVLRLKVLRAEGLKRADGGVAPARRPYVAVEVRQGRAQRTRACPGRTHHPVWGGGEGDNEGEALDFVVDDPRRQRLVLAVCEEEPKGAGAASAAAFSPALSRVLGIGGGLGGGGSSAAAPSHVLGVAQIAPLSEASFVKDLAGERVPLALVLRRARGAGGEDEGEPAPAAAAEPPAGASGSAPAAAAAAAEAMHLRGTLFVEATYLPFEQEKATEKEEEEEQAPPLALSLLLGGGGASPWAGGAPALAPPSSTTPGDNDDPHAAPPRGFLTVAIDRAGDLAFAGGGNADDSAVCVELRVGDPATATVAGSAGGGGGGGVLSPRRLMQRSSVVHGQRSPRWAGEKHDFCFLSLASVLVVTVLDVAAKKAAGGALLGRARVAVAEAAAAGGRARRRLPLAGALTGYVEVSLEWTPAGRMVGGGGGE
jgi:hypothetical protein